MSKNKTEKTTETAQGADDASSVTVTLTPKGQAIVALVKLGYTWERAERIVGQAPDPGPGRLCDFCDIEGPQIPAQLGQ